MSDTDPQWRKDQRAAIKKPWGVSDYAIGAVIAFVIGSVFVAGGSPLGYLGIVLGIVWAVIAVIAKGTALGRGTDTQQQTEPVPPPEPQTRGELWVRRIGIGAGAVLVLFILASVLAF